MRRDLEIAWAAGLFEGEGCFYVNSRGGQIGCALASTDKDVVERFAAIVQIGRVCRNAPDHRPNRKPQWKWTAEGRAVGGVIRAMLPYLAERRAAKAHELLALWEERYDPRPCPGCGEVFEPRSRRHRYCTPKCNARTNARKNYYTNLEEHRRRAREWQRRNRRREAD